MARRTWTGRRSLWRRRARSRRGVASAIAILFLILILVAVLNTYLIATLPGEMTQLEFQHALQVENAMTTFQASVLTQGNHPGAPAVVSTPLPLGSGGVPPFGLPAQGMLTTDPIASYNATLANMSSIGGLSVALYNRYFPAATIEFEEGAVIAGYPGNNSTMISGPHLNFGGTSIRYFANLTFVQVVVANFSQQVGTGVVGIQSTLLGVNVLNFTPTEYQRPLVVTTPYPQAWLNWASLYPQVFPAPTLPNWCNTPTWVNHYGANVCTISMPIYHLGLPLQLTVFVVTILVSIG